MYVHTWLRRGERRRERKGSEVKEGKAREGKGRQGNGWEAKKHGTLCMYVLTLLLCGGVGY